ncbi:putative E3 ubiquitin-protein ligase UBR7 [Drosophila ficusphila]|uniref:putative E3 ubiquitin-protein ligase UBR7 n=1 Tax=Drosophila ficusphila TaxID=30025 RepID=UPI001C897C09|nr:putative E3 ubiquitin-protein ligase UBR7 [Drosophila ficusphila]
MSELNATNGGGEGEEGNPLEQSTITMLDVLEQEKELEDEYAAVLGASDEKSCTYVKGPIGRQALYSCLTCCPEAREDLSEAAGVCLACSYRCHEHHELVELYTKRNFRCDCPTQRLGKCCLNPQLDGVQPKNEGNLYNQNFQGLYCKCKRPYPDPDRTVEEVMLQCAICEDWYHLPHMKAPGSSEKWLDSCSEMICDGCMDAKPFLKDYTGLAMQPVVEGSKDGKPEVEDSQLKNELDRSICDIMKVAEGETSAEDEGEPSQKRAKLEDCRRPTPKKEHQGAAFWTNDWRKSLCQCSECLSLYKELAVEFLLDAEDSAKTYEERGMKRAEENSSYEQGIRALASIDRTQQIDAITEYNRMKDKLKEYLQAFAASKKVVTEEDINRFFAGMRNENNANLGQPYFCR